jgi:hypothetical protein
MNSYMVHYPRNFANEYQVYAGRKARLEIAKEILDSRPRAENSHTRFISRKEAIRLGWSRVREAERDNEQWFGGFAESFSPPYPFEESVEQGIANAVEAAESLIDEHEASLSYEEAR